MHGGVRILGFAQKNPQWKILLWVDRKIGEEKTQNILAHVRSMGPIRTNMSPGSSIRIPPSGTPSDSWGISFGNSRGPSSRIYRRMYCFHFSLVSAFRFNSLASSTNVLPLPGDSSVGASGKTITSRGNAACSIPTMWLKMPLRFMPI